MYDTCRSSHGCSSIGQVLLGFWKGSLPAWSGPTALRVQLPLVSERDSCAVALRQHGRQAQQAAPCSRVKGGVAAHLDSLVAGGAQECLTLLGHVLPRPAHPKAWPGGWTVDIGGMSTLNRRWALLLLASSKTRKQQPAKAVDSRPQAPAYHSNRWTMTSVLDIVSLGRS